MGMLEKRGPFWESPPEKEVHLGSGPVGYTFGRSDLGVYTSQIGHAGKRRSVLIVPSATSDLRAWTCFSRAAPLSRSDLFFRPPRSDLFLWGSPTFQIGPVSWISPACRHGDTSGEGWISPQKKGAGGDGAPSQMFANLHQVKRLRIRSQNGCVHNRSGSARHCTKWVEQGGGSESGSSFIALLGRGPHKNCKNDLDDQT